MNVVISIQIVYEDFNQNDYFLHLKDIGSLFAKAVDDNDISKGFAAYKRVENFVIKEYGSRK